MGFGSERCVEVVTFRDLRRSRDARTGPSGPGSGTGPLRPLRGYTAFLSLEVTLGILWQERQRPAPPGPFDLTLALSCPECPARAQSGPAAFRGPGLRRLGRDDRHRPPHAGR